MKGTFALAIVIFFNTLLYAQEVDSIKVTNSVDTSKLEIASDSTMTKVSKDSLKNKNVESLQIKDSTNISVAVDSVRVDTIIAPESEYVKIKKSLLDSLLSRFYKKLIDTSYVIQLKKDSVISDTVFYKIDYLQKYRLSINTFTNDTSYVPLPEEKDYIVPKYVLDFDEIEIRSPVEQVKIDKVNYVRDSAWWINKNSIGLDIHQVAFANWNGGGENTIAGILKIYFGKTYKKQFTLWENEIFARYGLNKQAERELRKTDDQLRINSTFGYRSNAYSRWYYTAKFNFYTQFTDGFKYPDIENPISRFFAPAYLFLGAGARYNVEKKHFSVYMSPITLKSTFVFDEQLSNEGDFGVEPGQRSRHEFGVLIQTQWDTELFKNVAMLNRLGIYSDYLNNFGNVDFNWDLRLKFKINKFMEANIALQVLYDDDIKYKEDVNGDGELETLPARVQLKQQLGIGVSYKF